MSASVEYIQLKKQKVPLIYEESSSLPTVTFQLIFKNAGSLYDGDKEGIARLSSKLLGEGTKKKGSIKFAQKLENRAISLETSRGNETFVIELSSLKSEFNYGMKQLSKLLQDPNYTEDILEKIKKNTLGIIASKQNDFDYLASRELKKLLFAGSAYAQNSIGNKKSLDLIKLNDIKTFIDSHLVVENAIVVIGGDISIKSAKKYATTILKLLKSSSQITTLQKITPSTKIKNSRLIKKSEQAYIYFGSSYNIEVKDKDRYKASVASFILGSSGFGSRLMEEIRVKRGLAYSAYARVINNQSTSYFSGYLQTKLENEQKAIKIVKEVIAKFVKDGATQDELEAAKKFLIGSEPLRNETLSQRLHKTFMEYYKGLEFGSGKKDLELIAQLKLDDLNNYIKSHNEINNISVAIITGEKK